MWGICPECNGRTHYNLGGGLYKLGTHMKLSEKNTKKHLYCVCFQCRHPEVMKAYREKMAKEAEEEKNVPESTKTDH